MYTYDFSFYFSLAFFGQILRDFVLFGFLQFSAFLFFCLSLFCLSLFSLLLPRLVRELHGSARMTVSTGCIWSPDQSRCAFVPSCFLSRLCTSTLPPCYDPVHSLSRIFFSPRYRPSVASCHSRPSRKIAFCNPLFHRTARNGLYTVIHLSRA